MYEAVCTDGTDAFAYVASTQFVIVFMAFIILTFRVAFSDIQIGYDDENEHEYDAAEGSVNQKNGRNASKMAVAVDSPISIAVTASPSTTTASSPPPPTSPFSSASFLSLDEKRRETQRLQDRARASRKRQEEIGTSTAATASAGGTGTGLVLPSPSSMLQSRSAISIPFDERDSYQEGYFEEYYKNEGLLSKDDGTDDNDDETDLSAGSATNSNVDRVGHNGRGERSLTSSLDDDDDDDDDFISYQSSHDHNTELVPSYLDGNGCGGLVGEMVGIEVEHMSSTADAWSLWASQLWGSSGNDKNRRGISDKGGTFGK